MGRQRPGAGNPSAVLALDRYGPSAAPGAFLVGGGFVRLPTPVTALSSFIEAILNPDSVVVSAPSYPALGVICRFTKCTLGSLLAGKIIHKVPLSSGHDPARCQVLSASIDFSESTGLLAPHKELYL